MMFRKSLTGISLLMFLFAAQMSAQGIYDSYSGYTVPVTPNLPATESHPSLWFKGSEIDYIKNKKNANTYIGGVWYSIQSLINTYKSSTPASTTINTRPKMAKILALNWILYGDTLSRRKAIECLMIAYDNVPRTATSANFGGDYDEIYRATWLQNYCAAYDWIQNQLTSAQDSLIRAKLIEETLLLRNNMVAGVRYAPRPHNHRSKPAYGIITAALTFTSDSRAADWLQFGLTQANTCSKYQFSADGIYREGSHYLVYTAVNFLPYLWQYRAVSGVDHYQYCQAVFENPVRIRNSRGWLSNIEDGYVKPFPTHMVADGYKNATTALHPSRPLSEILQWNWNTTKFFTTGYTGATNDVVWEIDEYIMYDPAIAATAPQISGTQKLSSGVVVFRDNNDVSSNKRYLYFNGVAECDNHQHPDLLSYIMEYNNTIISTDAGYGKDGYDDAKRSWYTAPYSHNIVTTDSIAPYDMGVNIPPVDNHFIAASYVDYAEKQTKTKIGGGVVKRGILFPNKKYWVVFDAASSNIPADYRLYLHNRGSFAANVREFTWTTGSDNFGTPQKLFTTVLGSESVAFNSRTGYTSLWKDEVSQTYLEAKQTRDTVLFMHMLYPDTTAAAFPPVARSENSNYLVLIVGPAGEDFFIFKKRAVADTINSIITDGTVTWVNKSSSFIPKFAAIDARNFSANNILSFYADNKISIAGEIFDDTINLTIDTLATITRLSIKPPYSADSIISVKYNGQPVGFGIVNNMVEITLSGSGILQLFFRVTDADERVIEDRGGFSCGLIGNYPNPIIRGTRIRFYSNGESPVSLDILSTTGEVIRSVIKTETLTGVFDREWDGADNSGRPVPAGIYFFRLSDGKRIDYKKGILIK